MAREWEGRGQQTGGFEVDLAKAGGAGDPKHPLITLTENTSLSTKKGLLEITNKK